VSPLHAPEPAGLAVFCPGSWALSASASAGVQADGRGGRRALDRERVGAPPGAARAVRGRRIPDAGLQARALCRKPQPCPIPALREPDLCSYALCAGPGQRRVCSRRAERTARGRGSELRIPPGGRLWLYAPGAMRAGACAGRGCAQLTAASAPRSGVFTSPEFDGAGARPLPPAHAAHHCPQFSMQACLPHRPPPLL
jgi:hypothetical protein